MPRDRRGTGFGIASSAQAAAFLVGPMGVPVDVSYLADTVILTRYFEAGGSVRKAISIIKKRSGAHETTIRELDMTSSGVQIGEAGAPPVRVLHWASTQGVERGFAERRHVEACNATRVGEAELEGKVRSTQVPAKVQAEGAVTSLDELEGKEEIARLLDRARAGAAMKIFIGSENELFALSGSSVIAAPYRGGDGKVVGVVGVIGPTRLNYARVVPMVDFTAKALSRLLA